MNSLPGIAVRDRDAGRWVVSACLDGSEITRRLDGLATRKAHQAQEIEEEKKRPKQKGGDETQLSAVSGFSKPQVNFLGPAGIAMLGRVSASVGRVSASVPGCESEATC
jgi:hypothetical protein